MIFLLLSFAFSADWLTTKGNKIVDSGGNTVYLTGLNWFGFETAMKCFHGLWAANLENTVAEVAKRGFNVFRVPVSAELLHEWKDGKPVKPDSLNSNVNPNLDGKNNLEIFNLFVAECKKNGVKVFVDVHGVLPDSYMQALWFDSSHPVEYLYSALEWFADNFKSDDTIIGIDVKNEPHGQCDYAEKAVWDSSTADNNWKNTAETAAKRILAKNPNLLIFVEGIECFEGYGGWWGGNFVGATKYPLTIGKQLVYSPHEYGPSVFDQTWFHSGSFTFDSLYEEHWKPSWMFLYEQEVAPLLIGEWGGHLQGANLDWLKLMVQLIKEKGLSQTFWCLNPNSGDTGGLIKDDWVSWDEDKYKLIQPTLQGKLWAAK